jgi:hypothetical protein
MLLSLTLQPPLLVVEILPPPGIVGADRLQVAVRCGADPYLFPCRRDDQQLATLHLIRTEAISRLVQIDEPLPGTPPRPTRISR